MTTRRQLLKAIPAMTAALAIPGHTLAATEIPAMTKQARSELTPDQALELLKDGNERFVSGKMLQRDLMAQVKATATGQFPFAGILGCIDSRVPPEVVFDQGIGDIFSARIAGNFANTDFIGSFEFATKLAGAKLIVVLGHSECGAIKGAADNAQLGNLTQTLSNLMPAVYAITDVEGERNSANEAFVTAVAEENVRQNVKALLTRSTVLHDLAQAERIKVVGAMHDVGTGRITFLD
ncbi:MAG: carbonic anhydrase family protein [Candidatus Competibacteraceae bacterium]|jgi:carbonic anhydrase|nr:carbonic anhydrase family protein [Candidatus Competibacteraceae bacterium]